MKLKRAALTAGCLALALGGCERATTGQRIPIYDRPQVALLVVDFQKEFLDPARPRAVAPSAKRLFALGGLVREPRRRPRDAAAPGPGREPRAEALLLAAKTDVERIAAEQRPHPVAARAGSGHPERASPQTPRVKRALLLWHGTRS